MPTTWAAGYSQATSLSAVKWQQRGRESTRGTLTIQSPVAVACNGKGQPSKTQRKKERIQKNLGIQRTSPQIQDILGVVEPCIA